MKFVVIAGFLWVTAALAQSNDPKVCGLLTSSDVTAAIGAGFKLVIIQDGCSFIRRSDSVRVYARKSLSGAAGKTVAEQRNATAGAKPISGSCDAGFARPSGSILAAKGNWLVFGESSIGGKGDSAMAAHLVSALCSRL